MPGSSHAALAQYPPTTVPSPGVALDPKYPPSLSATLSKRKNMSRSAYSAKVFATMIVFFGVADLLGGMWTYFALKADAQSARTVLAGQH